MTSKQELLALQNERDQLEKEIQDAVAYLQSTSVGLRGSLIDSEGFPLGDCDHYSIREARNCIARRKNDVRALDEAIFAKLNELHETTRPLVTAALTSPAPRAETRPTLPVGRKAFATIMRVDDHSPAADGGLRPGDQVVQFGSLTGETFAGELREFGAVCASSVRAALVVTLLSADGVLRQSTITPRPWSGKGLLGCVIEILR